MAERVDTIAIIGVGLIGGSIGMAARAKGLARRVIGVDRDLRKLHRAKELAAIDSYATDLITAASEADLIFVCTPVLAIVPVIEAIAPVLKDGAIITDVGSTKSEITIGAQSVLPEGRHFVGGHPMAGSEQDGVEAARPYLLLNATYVITPTDDTNVQALNTLVGFAEDIGSNVVLMSPEQHDRSAAVISHLPHVLSASILRLAEEEQRQSGKVFDLAAGSFKDMTRVAGSPPELWVDICLSNKTAIVDILQSYETILAGVRKSIEAADADEIESLFEEGRTLRQTWVHEKQE